MKSEHRMINVDYDNKLFDIYFNSYEKEVTVLWVKIITDHQQIVLSLINCQSTMSHNHAILHQYSNTLDQYSIQVGGKSSTTHWQY